jgi:hypothetical protein
MNRAALTPKEQARFVRDFARNVTRDLIAAGFPEYYGPSDLRLLVAARFASTVIRSAKAERNAQTAPAT